MQLPAQFGKYRLEKFLGGGMSHVFQATDTVLQRQVAVKILTSEGCRDEDAKRRFLLEARMCGSIAHDNIIRVHDYGEEDGRPYIVMEFLVGEDLRTAIDKRNTGDLAAKIGIALQAARALGYIHTLNIIHRDIKPENLHVDQTGRVRLMDFGIAKTGNLSLTRTGFAVGTPYYMAPEQVLGKPVTHAVDIYAFGIVLYELLTGVKPVSGETVESLFYMILQQPLNMEPLESAGLPPALTSLIARCAAKQPEERPANFETIIGELDQIAGGGSPAPAPTQAQVEKPAPPAHAAVEERSGSRQGPLTAAGALLMVVLAAAAIYFLRSKPDAGPAQEGAAKSPAKVELPTTAENAAGGMVLVPAGKFRSGEQGVEKDVPAFYLDRTEVTMGAWQSYVQATGAAAKTGPGEHYPVTDITFDEAAQFCSWAGKRLPTADEWEKGARGADGRKYPWGDDEDPSRANVAGNKQIPANRLQPVDALPGGASPYGALHMAGNAWEWVRQDGQPKDPSLRALVEERMRQSGLTPLTPEDIWFVVRGGGYDFALSGAVLWEYAPVPARFKSPAIGFRCVADPR